MGFATYNPVKYPIPDYVRTNADLRLCQRCGATYNVKGDWHKAIDVSTGTQSPEFISLGVIPKGQCINCGAKESV